MKESPYFPVVKLLLQALPHIEVEESLALKGGTAINLFLRPLPRLSVDIDLTYMPIQPREESLASIEEALKRISARLTKAIPGSTVTPQVSQKTGKASKAVVRNGPTQIKIEINEVVRSSVYPPKKMRVVPEVEDLFATSASMSVLDAADLYGGKICAALDRQHPRDFFDVWYLFQDSGITREICRAFVGYLASGVRPMAELLDPSRLCNENPRTCRHLEVSSGKFLTSKTQFGEQSFQNLCSKSLTPQC